MNFLNFDDIIKGVNILIEKKINPGEYLLKSKNEIKIIDLIKRFNFSNKKKIKFRIKSNKLIYPEKSYNKKLPFWRQKYHIEKDFNKLINENN